MLVNVCDGCVCLIVVCGVVCDVCGGDWGDVVICVGCDVVVVSVCLL